MSLSEKVAKSIDVFNWWMEFDILPNQISFDDLEEENDDISIGYANRDAHGLVR